MKRPIILLVILSFLICSCQRTNNQDTKEVETKPDTIYLPAGHKLVEFEFLKSGHYYYITEIKDSVSGIDTVEIMTDEGKSVVFIENEIQK